MSNRAAKYEQLHKSLKKHFRSLPEPGERSVLEHLLYACCLEDAKAEQADEAFAKLQQAYFDWNEVRVTTVIELAEALVSLPNPTQAGHRIKRCLQSLFEARYQYDIDDLKKANLSKATEEMTAWKGISPFVLNYVSQNALGGHAIPVDSITLDVMVDCEILTHAEAEKKLLPGVERAIPKNKGSEFASLLHQFAIEFQQHPKNPAALSVFKDLGVSPKPKSAHKPASKKETAESVDHVPSATDATPATKTKGAQSAPPTAKASTSPDTATAKKADKGSVEATKSKDTHAKDPQSKGDGKSEKPLDPKKKSESKAEPKTAAKEAAPKEAASKEAPAKKSEKAVPKPAAKKDEKGSPKKLAPKPPPAKPTTKEPAKKSSTSAKASKPESEPKKAAPPKKSDKPSTAGAKGSASTTPTKKKPR